MTTRVSTRRGTIAAGVVAAAVAAGVAFPPTRHLAARFFASLREPRVQAVNVNLSSFVGPGANRTLR